LRLHGCICLVGILRQRCLVDFAARRVQKSKNKLSHVACHLSQIQICEFALVDPSNANLKSFAIVFLEGIIRAFLVAEVEGWLWLGVMMGWL